jgi:hypothetical protein
MWREIINEGENKENEDEMQSNLLPWDLSEWQV